MNDDSDWGRQGSNALDLRPLSAFADISWSTGCHCASVSGCRCLRFGNMGIRWLAVVCCLGSPAQSRHSVRDLGLQFIARTVEHDARSFREEGLTEKPTRIELMNVHGVRLLAWTWTAPSGPPAHYAQRVRLLFDLQHPWPSGEAAWDERGDLPELIRFEDVVPRHWSESIFDRRNPEYGFH
jgi:hypothetical protein